MRSPSAATSGGAGGLSIELPAADGPSRHDVPRPDPAASPSTAVAAGQQPVNPDARNVARQIYTVRSGDTLRGIGNRTGAGSEAIARANGLIAPFAVKTGQRLTIPAGRYHLVKPGETGIAIARAYGTDWTTLATMNGLEAPFVLRAGRRLRVPGAASPTASPAASPATGATGGGSDPNTAAPAASTSTSRAPAAADAMSRRAARFSTGIDGILAGVEPAPPARPNGGGSLPRAIDNRAVGHFAWPVEGGRILRKFGPYGEGRLNQGIDIAASLGSPIRASADGTVVYAGTGVAVFGGLVLLRHPGGWTSAYGYARDLQVAEGQGVRRGDILARVGPGGDLGTQLHFELRYQRKPVDPVTRLRR